MAHSHNCLTFGALHATISDLTRVYRQNPTRRRSSKEYMWSNRSFPSIEFALPLKPTASNTRKGRTLSLTLSLTVLHFLCNAGRPSKKRNAKCIAHVPNLWSPTLPRQQSRGPECLPCSRRFSVFDYVCILLIMDRSNLLCRYRTILRLDS